MTKIEESPSAPPNHLLYIPGEPPPPPAEGVAPGPVLTPKTPASVRISLVTLAILGAIAFCFLAREILVPLVLGVFISYVLSPIISWLQTQLKIPRGAAVGVMVLLAALVFGILGYALAWQAITLTAELPAYSDKIRELAVRLAAPITRWQEMFRSMLPAGAAHEKSPTPVEIVGTQLEFLPAILVRMGSIMGLVGEAFLVLFIVLFALAEGPKFRQRLLDLIGPAKSNTASRVLDDINKGIMGYLWGTLLVGLVVFAGTTAILWPFRASVPYPALWGLLAALLNLVPYLGAIVAIIPPLILASLDPHHHAQVVWILSLYTAFRTLEGNFIMPAMLGHTIDMNPFAVIVCLMFWGWVWGPIGLILGVPVTVAMIVICDNVPGWLGVGTFLGGKRRARFRILTPKQVKTQQALAEQTRVLELEAQPQVAVQAPA